MKDITPSTAVKAILPVTFADPGTSPKYVIDKNKKENSEQVGQVFLVIVSQIWLGHFVAYESDNWLNGILKSCGRFCCTDTPGIFSCHTDQE